MSGMHHTSTTGHKLHMMADFLANTYGGYFEHFTELGVAFELVVSFGTRAERYVFWEDF